ncbi:MAG TPA: Ig-like domain-containing protein, partial [Acinetobacter sp.]|nr:Ig-like domain-containing protein [Acinetobacter sp.]
MPNQTVTIKLHDAKTIISALQVTKTHDQPVTIQAQKGINYELIDDATQFAPENIKIQRVGNDLYIGFEDDGVNALDPDLIIQGYYGTDGTTTNLLIGLHENGSYYAYVPETGAQQHAVSMLADQVSVGQALGGEPLTSAAYEFNPYWLLALIPLVGLAAAGGGGGGGGGTPAPSTDKPDVVALNGGVVTVKPGSNNVKQVITYTDESNNPVSLIATKGSDGKWSLEKTPTGVSIDSSTGLVTIGMDAVKDGSIVKSVGTDADNNTATDSDTAKADETDTQGSDLIAPTLEISATDLNLALGETTTITFSFSEAVTGFNTSDITVAGGSLTGLTTTDNITWTATFTQDGTATAPSISVADNTYTDLAGNLGTGDAFDDTDGFGSDIIVPTLEISATDLNLALGESTTITFSFSEAVTGFNTSDITVAGGSLTGLTTTDNITWTATFT